MTTEFWGAGITHTAANLTASAAGEIAGIGAWLGVQVTRIIGDGANRREILQVATTFAKALPMIALQFCTPWYVSLSFWTLYAVCQARVANVDRGISIAFALDAACETGRFVITGLSKGVTEGWPSAASAIAGIFCAAFFDAHAQST